MARVKDSNNVTSEVETALAAILTSVSRAANVQEKNAEVVKDAKLKRIVIPDTMSLDEAIHWLERKREEEETKIAIAETIETFPLDGAVGLMKVLERRFGWTNLVPTPGFWGPEPPAMVGVEVDAGKTTQVAWGSFKIPGIEDGRLESGFAMHNGMPVFVIRGNIKRKYEKLVHEVADEVRSFCKTDSIYRGKACRINFRKNGQRMQKFSPDFAPRFIDVSKIDLDQLVLPEKTGQLVEVSLFTPVRKSELCRQLNIPLKRGVLLEGNYGTGKTLTATMLSRICYDNGWTFLYLEDCRDLELAINLARLYSPAVIFAEDVDEAVKDERNSEMNSILNTLDGCNGKKDEIIVVLTTNNVDRIHPAFVRPGRIDAVVHLDPPDDKATVALVRRYGSQWVECEDKDVVLATKAIRGQNAAVVREVVERAKLAAIGRLDENSTVDDVKIRVEDLGIASAGMEQHLALLNRETDKPLTCFEQLGKRFERVEDSLGITTDNQAADDE